ncbi:Protein CSN12 [Vanrija pseudolonga]|uniref:Protein CSN12 homolog n=1 Tax=Vanrija pseudolonga TaxID=143232 RepID=A0AAF1BL93_9TREE|nr:Protein CSN12 [Vanrija pseudolonga]
MKLHQFIQAFAEPLRNEDATPLLRLLDSRNRTARGLSQTVGPIDDKRLQNPGHTLPEPWDGIAVRHCAAVHALYNNDYASAYSHQHQLVILFFRWFQEQPAWALPVLYLVLRDLRELAEQADAATFSTGGMPSLEECTRTVSKAFSICATDRTFKGAQSRRNGVYHVACLSIKCYFKVGKPNLCKNIVRAVVSDPKTPPVDEAPLTDQVTWHYYMGMLAFLNGEDKKATDELTWALLHCPADAVRNQELILTYLIPLHLLRGSFPRPKLLEAHPRLAETYAPFVKATRNGDIADYDEHLEAAQTRLVGLNTYLAVERAREGCLRVLFKKAWIASDKSSRVPISTFQTALRLHGVNVDSDEVECMVANMIYRGFIKGYISHEKQMVVLASKTPPFPALASMVR